MRAGGFSIAVHREPRFTVALVGELDLSSVTQLREAISDLDPARQHLTVDMSELEFIDLAGLVAVSESVADLRARGGTVDLILSDAVSWLLGTLDAAGCPVPLGSHADRPSASG